MATITLGTAATTTLTAAPFIYGMPLADFAAINAAIKRDAYNPEMNDAVASALSAAQPPLVAALARAGVLYIPDRGMLRLFPGDMIGIDATGWPILLSPRAAASASWVHT